MDGYVLSLSYFFVGSILSICSRTISSVFSVTCPVSLNTVAVASFPRSVTTSFNTPLSTCFTDVSVPTWSVVTAFVFTRLLSGPGYYFTSTRLSRVTLIDARFGFTLSTVVLSTWTPVSSWRPLSGTVSDKQPCTIMV